MSNNNQMRYNSNNQNNENPYASRPPLYNNKSNKEINIPENYVSNSHIRSVEGNNNGDQSLTKSYHSQNQQINTSNTPTPVPDGRPPQTNYSNNNIKNANKMENN